MTVRVPGRSLIVAVAAAALALVACGSKGPSVGAFCDTVRADQSTLVGTPSTTPGGGTTTADAAGTVRRYQEVGKVAPEAIRDEWRQLTDLMVQAAAADPTKPDDQTKLTEAAYAASKAAATVTTYVQSTCGVVLGPVAPPSTAGTTTTVKKG